jgi:hypothetical protein
MIFYDVTMLNFEKCMASIKVPWSAAWEEVPEADLAILGGVIGMMTGSALLLLTRCITRL